MSNGVRFRQQVVRTGQDDYLKSLFVTKDEVDVALSRLLETVLKLASDFAGTPDRFDDGRITGDSQVD